MARQINDYIQPINPTDEERYKMIQITLQEANRLEDFYNIIELLSPPKDITTIKEPGSCRGSSLGIIGGGLAGLASAFELRKLGFDITIFETQENRIGGRVYTHYFDKEKRFYGEFGAMRIPVSHETTWHYINTFALKTRPFIQNNENTFIYVRNKRARNDKNGRSVMENIYPEFNLTPIERVTPWQKLIGDALVNNLMKIKPEIRKELIQIKDDYSPIIKYIGSKSIREVLEKSGLSQEAIDLISGIAPFLGSFYYNSYSENLIEEYTLDYAYRYKIVEGMINFPLSFYYSLLSEKPKEYSSINEKNLGKVVWGNGKTVTGIFEDVKENKVMLEYTNSKSSEKQSQAFDFVVCAIPFSSLRNLEIHPMFSDRKMQAIKEVFYTSSQKTLFMCRERFWERGNKDERIFGGGSNTDLPISTIWYPSHNISMYNEDVNGKDMLDLKSNNLFDNLGVLLASYNLNLDSIRLGNLSDNVRFEKIKRQLEAVHGLREGYLESVIEEYMTVDWNREKGFYGGFCYFKPEQQFLFSYAMEQPEYNNKIYFAGEHISLTHGWIEGALSSGMKAANNIAEYCKRI